MNLCKGVGTFTFCLPGVQLGDCRVVKPLQMWRSERKKRMNEKWKEGEKERGKDKLYSLIGCIQGEY